MADVMALGVAIRAEGTAEAIQALKSVEQAGVKSAATQTRVANQASREIIDAIMRNGSASAKAQLQSVLGAQQAATQTVAATVKKEAAITAAELRMSAHFQRMRQREIASAERAAYAEERARTRAIDAVMRANERASVAAQRASQQQVQQATSAGRQMAQRYGTAALSIAGSFNMITSSGKVSAESVKMLVSQLSFLAFNFGPHGKLVAAIGLAGVSIANLFSNAREELKKTREAFDEEITKIVNAGDRAALMQKGAELTLGTPAMGADRARGILGADAIASITAEIKRLEAPTKDAGVAIGRAFGVTQQLGEGFTKLRLNSGETVKSLDDLKQKLRELSEEWIRIQQELLNPKMPFRMRETPEILASVAQRFGGLDSLRGLSERVTAEQARAAEEAVRSALERRAGPERGAIGQGAAAMATSAADLRKMIQVQAQDPAIQAIRDTEEAISQAVDTHIAGGIGRALMEGFEAAFSGEGIAGLIKGFGASLMSSMGQMFVELGQHLVKFGSIMEALKKAFQNIFGTGAGAVVAGVALMALGAAMMGGAGAILRGGSGGGGSSFAAGGRTVSDQATRYTYNPLSQQMMEIDRPGHVTNHITVIGPNDPVAQRQMQELMRKAGRRGG